MSGDDVRHALNQMVDDARGELEAAVVKFDALDVLRDLAWSTETDGGMWMLEDVEQQLTPVDRARFRAALRTVAELLPEPDEVSTPDD